MLLGVLGGDLGSPGHWHKDVRVGLGLDLSSGTQVTMKATTPAGGVPTGAEMNDAISIILARVNGTGNSGAQVQPEGNQDVNVSVPGTTSQQTASLVSTTALLLFRQVLLWQPYSASSSPSPKASPSASESASASTAYGDSSLVGKSTLALFDKLVCKPGDSSNWKKQAGYTTAAGYDNPAGQTVACDPTTGDKYALAVAPIQGKEVSNAVATVSTANEWEVDLTLSSAASSAFAKLTAHMASTYYPGYQSGNENDYALDQDAIVLDGNVVTSPYIGQTIPGGTATISGSFTKATATQLQNMLKYGSLPLTFTILSVQSVSPQLGRAQLDGGLIAAAIGLGLVVIYSFLYYRGLGLVSVTADSFVVFFERLRDEVREGKQLRPAVEAGWKRARRTILVSDTVSFLAALLLYYFSIGEVKGFAYTLGLTTLIDILVVFLFTKPMVTLLARTRFYGNGAPLSGLDPARLGARTPWRSSVPRLG